MGDTEPPEITGMPGWDVREREGEDGQPELELRYRCSCGGVVRAGVRRSAGDEPLLSVSLFRVLATDEAHRAVRRLVERLADGTLAPAARTREGGP